MCFCNTFSSLFICTKLKMMFSKICCNFILKFTRFRMKISKSSLGFTLITKFIISNHNIIGIIHYRFNFFCWNTIKLLIVCTLIVFLNFWFNYFIFQIKMISLKLWISDLNNILIISIRKLSFICWLIMSSIISNFKMCCSKIFKLCFI